MRRDIGKAPEETLVEAFIAEAAVQAFQKGILDWFILPGTM